MTKHKQGKQYNDDFREVIVNVYNSAHLVKKLSSEYGVSDVTIYAQIKKLGPIEMEDRSSITPDDYNKLQEINT